MSHYILKGKEAVRVNGVMVWAKWLEENEDKKIIRQEELSDGKWVSTVFLGLDHNFGGGKPLIFETMVFPKWGELGELDMDRYSTYKEAEAGHKRMVKKWEGKK